MEQVGFNTRLKCSKQMLYRGVHIPNSVCAVVCAALWIVYVCLEVVFLFVFVCRVVCICQSVYECLKAQSLDPRERKMKEKAQGKVAAWGSVSNPGHLPTIPAASNFSTNASC